MRRSLKLLVLGAGIVMSACEDDDPTAVTLPTPVNVTVTATSPTTVTVGFATVSGADSYRIERATGTGATFTQIGTTTTAPYIDNTVTAETTYRYRVSATSSSSNTTPSAWSTDVSVTTPAAGPRVATIEADITANRTLHADTVYTLRGFIHVANGATLTIQPGTRILGDFNTLGSSLFIMRGARIMACGTAQAPIVFTSSRAVGQRQPGDWGGLAIVGNARINRSSAELEGTGPNTGGAIAYGGGTNDSDSSGELCYVRVEFAGYAISADNELNAFTFAAVGSGTKLEYLQALAGLDDHFEWFGGTVDSKYLVSYESGDDHFDASEGYRGRSQFMIAFQSKVLIPRTGAGNVSSDPQGIENDGCGASGGCTNGQTSEPFTIPLWANFTLIGTGPGFVDATSGGYGMVLRRGTGGYYLNGVVARWPKGALSVRDASTTARVTAGDMFAQSILAAENGALLQAGQQPYDTTANNVRSIASSAASLFTLLPTNPTAAANFDWSPANNSAMATGGLNTFPAAVAARAGTFVVPTTYRGAAAPGGVKWWEGWTSYANF
jgi:hypothetical protein